VFGELLSALLHVVRKCFSTHERNDTKGTVHTELNDNEAGNLEDNGMIAQFHLGLFEIGGTGFAVVPCNKYGLLAWGCNICCSLFGCPHVGRI
jgi:hypothetical protein